MKKADKKVSKAPARLSKKQLSRYERERKLQRIALVGAALLALLFVGVLAAGFWREVLSRPGEAMAAVNSKAITAETYAKMLGYSEYSYDAQIYQLQDYVNQVPASEHGNEDSSNFLRQYAQQQLQQLQFRKYTLDSEVLDNLIDNELIRTEAARRGISVAKEEVDNALIAQFTPPSTITPTKPITSTEQGGNATPAVTNTKTLPQVQDDLRRALAQTGFLSEAEYRYYVLEPSLLTEKVQKAIGDEVKTSGEQVHASHILVEAEEDAKKALSSIKDEGRDFASVAKELSKDTASKEEGGDLGWFPRGVMLPEFEQAVFNLSPGQISDPVKTVYGYHVIRLEERQSDRAISEEVLQSLKSKAFSDWIANEKLPEQKKVERFDSPTAKSWARSYVDGKRKALAEQARKQAGAQRK